MREGISFKIFYGISTAGTPIGQLLLRYPLWQFSCVSSGFGTAAAQKVEEPIAGGLQRIFGNGNAIA